MERRRIDSIYIYINRLFCVEREKGERETERDRETERQRERQRDRETERETDRERERESYSLGEGKWSSKTSVISAIISVARVPRFFWLWGREREIGLDEESVRKGEREKEG